LFQSQAWSSLIDETMQVMPSHLAVVPARFIGTKKQSAPNSPFSSLLYIRWNIADADWSNKMTDVTFTNRRADSSANEDLTKLARHGADAFGYKAQLRIDWQLAQLLRLRVAQINNCVYCLNLHYEAARDAGIARPVVDTLTAWWETDFHSDATRAALGYTEAITRVADATAADDFGARHDALAEHFSPEEILEIVGIVINMNVWTRLKLAEGAVPVLGEREQTIS
jgi:AhpD family alkylhydroperoxidase